MRRRFGYMPEERGLYPSMRVARPARVPRPPARHGRGRRAPGRRASCDAARAGRAAATPRSRSSRSATSSGCSWPPRSSTIPTCWSSTSRSPASTRSASTTSSQSLAERARAGATVLFSSHQLDLVEHLCEEVAIVDHGRLVAAGVGLRARPRRRAAARRARRRRSPTAAGPRRCPPARAAVGRRRRRPSPSSSTTSAAPTPCSTPRARPAGSSSSGPRRGGCRRCSARRSAATRPSGSRSCTPREPQLVDRTLLVARREWDERIGARSYRITTLVLVARGRAGGRDSGAACPAAASRTRSASSAAPRRRSRHRAQAGAVLDEKVAADPVDQPGGRDRRSCARASSSARLRRRPRGADQAGRPPSGASDTTARLADAIAQLARPPAAQVASTVAPRCPSAASRTAPTSLSTRLTGMAVGDPDLPPHLHLRPADHQRRRRGEVKPCGRDPAGQRPPGAAADRQGPRDRRDRLRPGGGAGGDVPHRRRGDRLEPAARSGRRRRRWSARSGWCSATRCTAPLFAAAGSMVTPRVRRHQRHLPGRPAAAVRLRAVLRDHLRRLEQRPLQVLAYIPPPRRSPARPCTRSAASGSARSPISAVICLLATVATARLAASVYERSILRIGARVRLRDALRTERLRRGARARGLATASSRAGRRPPASPRAAARARPPGR